MNLSFSRPSTLNNAPTSAANYARVKRLAIAFALCATLVFVVNRPSLFAVDAPVTKQNVEEFDEDAPVKWLPDLRVLAGAPTTTLELDETLRQLCSDGRLGDVENVDPNDVEWSLLLNGDDIAEFRIVGSKLFIEWKPGVVGKTTVVVNGTLKADETQRVYLSFKAESWTPNYLAILLTVLGGGGLFLLGMKRMSEGLQAIAGKRLSRMVAIFTNNKILAVGVGALVTTLVQSSTATSVMTLGFVNSGLMTLTQATGVMLGANIGTTTTGWLFALNVGALGLPVLGVAALFYIFSKKDRVQNFSLFFLGLGMIFFGLETLKEGLSPLPDTPQFSSFMQAFQATSMKGAFMCVLVGCVATVVAHSSAATLALTMTLASLGALDLNSSAAIVLGSNVGTALTPILVAIGAPASTRRAAYFHVVFNTLGVAWVLCVFFPVLVPSINALGNAFDLGITGRIALTHTLFNVVNTIVFLPFIDLICKLLERWVVDKEEPKKGSVTGLLDLELNETAILSIGRSHLVVEQMFIDCETLGRKLSALYGNQFSDRTEIDASFDLEDKLDHAQDETIEFITRLTHHATTAEVAESACEQIRVAEEIETISDYFVAILKSNLKLQKDGLEIPSKLAFEFGELLKEANDSIRWLKENFSTHSHAHIDAAMNKKRNENVAKTKAIRKRFVQEMLAHEPLVITAIDYQINAWRRIFEHLREVAEAMEPSSSRGSFTQN